MILTPLLGLAVALVLVGLAGTILPFLPGPPLVFAGLLLAAWADGFSRVGWPSLALLAVLTLAAVLVDFLGGAWGARRRKASRQAVLGAILGSCAGLFFGIPGLILGPFLGAAGGEYLACRALAPAGRVGLATWLGMLIGGALRLALVALMVLWFAVDFAG